MKSPGISLFSKNFSQHAIVVLAGCLFGLIYVGALVVVSEVNGRVLSHLSIVASFAKSGLLLVGVVFGQRFITNEYYNRTQRFLESLPVSRLRVVVAQYGFGLVSLLLVMGVVWGCLVWLAAEQEPIRERFLLLMLGRWASFSFALWGLVFVFAMLGRLRIPLAAVAGLVTYFVFSNTTFELDRFGPFALMDSDLFAFERRALPTIDVLVTLGIGLVLLIAGLTLANLREGSFIESLANPMGVREKGFILGLVVLGLGASVILQPEPPIAPFEFTDDRVLRKGVIEVSYLESQRAEDAQRLTNYLHGRISALSELVATRSADFKLRIGLDTSLDARDFRTGQSSAEFGVVAYTNFIRDPEWDIEYFGSYVMHQWLAANANQELSIESGHWLLDGFSRWWATHGAQPAPALSEALDPLVLEALYILTAGLPDERSLEDWDKTTQRYGEVQSMTVAYFGWRVLADLRGHATVLKLADTEFNRLQHHDIRDWWYRYRHPAEQRFAEITGVSMTAFIEQWRAMALELMQREDYAAALGQLPDTQLDIQSVVTANGGLGLRYSLRVETPPAVGTRCVALHQPLGPYDVALGRGGMREVIVHWPATEDSVDGEIASPIDAIDYDLAVGEYGPGSRVFVGFECRLPGLSTDISFGQKILVMQ